MRNVTEGEKSPPPASSEERPGRARGEQKCQRSEEVLLGRQPDGTSVSPEGPRPCRLAAGEHADTEAGRELTAQQLGWQDHTQNTKCGAPTRTRTAAPEQQGALLPRASP